jgi:hypothetical protein
MFENIYENPFLQAAWEGWQAAVSHQSAKIAAEQQSHDAELRRIATALGLAWPTTIEDIVEAVKESIPFSQAPCGHSSQYSYTLDGGKHIVCLLCEYQVQNPPPSTISAAVAVERELCAQVADEWHPNRASDCDALDIARAIRDRSAK